MKLVLTILLLNCFFCPFGQTNPTVFIKGNIKNINNQCEVENMSAVGRISLPNQANFFIADSLGRFQLEMEMLNPGYYRIGRNILYLSPGDTLYMELDNNKPENAKFEGSHAIANDYLKMTPFPLAGSYLAYDSIMMPTIEETISNIIQYGKEKEKILLSLKNPPKEFTRMEKARIRADIINSILDLYYEFPDFHKLSGNSRETFEKNFMIQKDTLIRPFTQSFIDSTFLDLVVYQKIASSILNSNPIEKTNKHFISIQDWLAAQKVFKKMMTNRDKSNFSTLSKEINLIKRTVYRQTLENVLNEISALGNGDIAPNFLAENSKGEKVSIEQLKGKTIFIDLWATWCGPCIRLLPKIEALRELLKADTGIVIITLSIDDDKDKWRKAISKYAIADPNWVVDRSTIPEYQIYGIPRTIIIDKFFKIHAFNGPSAENVPDIARILNEINKKE